MKRKIGFCLLFVSIAAILGAVGLISYNVWFENMAYERAMKTAQALYDQIQDPADNSYTELFYENAAPLMEINGEYYLGILNIPSLSVKLPINSILDDTRMESSPCRYTGDLYSSLVIGAHNYKRHFGGIKSLSKGDELSITDATGYEHNYTVELITTLHGSEVDAMVNNPYDLTLFTCTKSRTERVTIRCTRLDSTEKEALETEIPTIVDDPNAPNAPTFRIDYKNEIIKLRKGYLYSMNGVDFTEITESKGAEIDVTACITSGSPVYIKKAPSGKQPMSNTQILTPVARAILEAQVLTPESGKLKLDEEYEVYSPSSKKWGALPKITANAALDIRLKSSDGQAASLPGKLILTYDEEGRYIATAEIMP